LPLTTTPTDNALSPPRGRRREGGRLFAIGDIHGCPDELGAMLHKIAPRTGDTVIFVGDYVDRGPSSRDVIELVLDLSQSGPEVVCLKGNHEDMMLSFLGFQGRYGESFLFNGGAATLDSYGVRESELRRAVEHLPPRHIEFLRGLALSYLRPPYFFVHAGIQPSRQLQEQDAEDLLWIRQEFIFRTHRAGATVVFGHTPMRDTMIDVPYKIGIDTGLVYGGKLTCLEFNEGVMYQISRGSSEVKSRRLELP
jgi:serine/threonine protein phosphatase 1